MKLISPKKSKKPVVNSADSKKAKSKKVPVPDFQTDLSQEIEHKISNLSTGNPPVPAEIATWYWLEKPFAAVAITREKIDYVYNIITPTLSSSEYDVLNRVYNRLVDRLSLTEQDPEKVFNSEAASIIHAYLKVNKIQEAKLSYFLKRKSLGYDSIDPLYKDSLIEEITCNGPNLPVYVYHIEYGFMPTNITYSENNLDDFTSHLAELANRHICIGEPVAEASLKDGSRLTAFWRNEISDRGSSFGIRKIRLNPFSPTDLIRLGTFNSELMGLVWYLIEHKINILVIGGTASGKTTTLNALSLFIPKNRRIVSIEDTRELRLMHDNWVPLVTRQDKKIAGLTSGIDEMFLLKRALRLRPEYLLVGEVRGEEASILFQAMNTGHIVFSTIHAGSVDEVFIRLFNPPISVPPAMILPLDLVLVQSLVQSGHKEVRRCVSLSEIKEVDVENQKAVCSPLYTWNSQTDRMEKTQPMKRVFEKLKRLTGKNQEDILNEIRQRQNFLEELLSSGTQNYVEFTNAIDTYRQKIGADLIHPPQETQT
ncbi:MAG: type II/IV secretion system ATPase subunit [Candidatus Bathyarchaeota archaeon]|nr:type II/IV secretion system ATPase subunit [Candidatus Bathyarchaeota archaeon]